MLASAPLGHTPMRDRYIGFAVAVCTLLALGMGRIATDAEFVFVSLSLLPVLAGAWVVGLHGGVWLAALATSMWLVGDVTSTRLASADWVLWVNGATHLSTYGLAVGLTTRLRGEFDKARACAYCDELTQLHNRRAFFALGRQALVRARRNRTPVAIAFIDLDNFKQVNDRQGHEVGDRALCMAARALRRETREADVLARLGGDEFVVLLGEVDRPAAARAGVRLLEAVRADLERFGGLSASLGVAWFERVDRPIAELLVEADRLMHRAKREGKDTMEFAEFGARGDAADEVQ